MTGKSFLKLDGFGVCGLWPATKCVHVCVHVCVSVSASPALWGPVNVSEWTRLCLFLFESSC